MASGVALVLSRIVEWRAPSTILLEVARFTLRAFRSESLRLQPSAPVRTA